MRVVVLLVGLPDPLIVNQGTGEALANSRTKDIQSLSATIFSPNQPFNISYCLLN
jgi:hypothetical protein